MNIRLISTGGTILSQMGGRGLAPTGDAGDAADEMRSRFPSHSFSLDTVMSLDSSNIQPEHWQEIADAVYRSYEGSDGFIILHGTDTMAYTSSALSFMLRNLGKAVTLTGSQIPLEDPRSDGWLNLAVAVAAVEGGINGVTVSFCNKIISGVRAVKASADGIDAFISAGAPPLATVTAFGLRAEGGWRPPFDPDSPLSFERGVCPDVFLIKMTPGLKPEIFDALLGIGYKGIVVEAFGAGGMHSEGRDAAAGVARAASSGVPVVVRSQCLYGATDLSVYEVGRRLLDAGAIPAGGMTAEATVAKLMWALAKTADVGEIERMFQTNYAGEML
ncbi:MAG: asparaginase [Synergistaceae bacterium]|jgi:L-asparaginase|nr:asparaginase [Synergistaceae bacterium]